MRPFACNSPCWRVGRAWCGATVGRAAAAVVAAVVAAAMALAGLLPAAWAQPESAANKTPAPPESATPGPPPVLNLLAPREARSVVKTDRVHVLGRTLPDTRVVVGGEPTAVFSTGVFVRDNVPLVPGDNEIVITAEGPDGQTRTHTLQVQRQPPDPGVDWPTQRLFINGSSLQPSQLVYLKPGEFVDVSVQATAGQRVRAQLPGQPWKPLYEASPGHYRASLSLAAAAATANVTPAPVRVELQATLGPGVAAPRRIQALTPGAVGQWPLDPDRLWVVAEDGAGLLHGLHEVRLGGPFLAELHAGALLHVTGQHGPHLRVRLAPDTEAWVAASQGRWAPAGTAPPKAHFTSLSVQGSATGDVVSIPLAATVPYAVRAVAQGDRQGLELELFDTHHAATWVSHLASAQVVREVTVEQVAPGRVRVHVALHGPRLWGWRAERSGQALRLLVRAAPALAVSGPSLAGLRVAVEAGHGGPSNPGAVGPTGTPEKDINRWTAEALKETLEAAGADVLMVRRGDDNPGLRERAEQAVAAQAHVYISLHANAAEVSRGYGRVSGTSTYYKHAHSRALAAAIQQQMLQHTGLADFGLVGNFNYAPIRLATWMPAVLVEQAFVSNPADEAQLLDPAVRQRIAQAVRLGLEAFLRAP